MRYFDDIDVGDRIALGTHTFTAENIKAFAAQYDPQEFHMDEAAAAQSHFGALCASGWHTVAAWMNLRVQYGRREDAERAARGEVIAKLGPSPGFRELKWLKPIRPGDSLTVRGSVTGVRTSQSKPDRGFVTFFWEVFNDRGEKVMTLTCPQMLLRRNAGAPA